MIGIFEFINLSEISYVLKEVNLISISIRLGLAMFFGGIIGIERGRKRRPAGFRTYMLVCVGSALTMITNQYVFETFIGANIDPVRMGAQVVSGVGFLGAGTIMTTSDLNKKGVVGLTSAAALWASACMGLAIGIGFYTGAIIACFYIFSSVTWMHSIGDKFYERSKVINIYADLDALSGLSGLLKCAEENNLQISDLDIKKEDNEKNLCIFFTVRTLEKRTHSEMISILGSVENVKYISEVL